MNDKGLVSHEIAKSFAESEFEKYRIVQDRLFANDFDKLLALETAVKDITPPNGKKKKGGE